MQSVASLDTVRRYQAVADEKAAGATYTPENLARFVAEQIAQSADLEGRSLITILDPAIGDGELVLALLDALKDRTTAALIVRGFDTDKAALAKAARRINAADQNVELELTQGSFLDFVLGEGGSNAPSLFGYHTPQKFDLIIANPPYVRTQIMGSQRAQQLAEAFSLAGRVDLYQAFLLGMADVLALDGAAGMIVSNRFMSTKGGGGLRAALRERFNIQQVWDLGDTKLFSAAVLPAVLIARGTDASLRKIPHFTSIYETKEEASHQASDPIDALSHDGVIQVNGGRRFRVRHGLLDETGGDADIWRLASASGNDWMAAVDRHTWKRFGDIGKIRVGVKTCADKIFIGSEWDALGSDKPELLRPLTTHHTAGRYRANEPKKERAILYPHEVVQGIRQAIPLEKFPKSFAYLKRHRAALERRTYVIEAGRHWYELWVPQDPEAWSAPKLVFRDISERPTFWVDLSGSVVNGDCYWLATKAEDETDLLWLAAAVANSTFAEAFYDNRFNNKLYAGRRRFITQYVEQFPLPDPTQLLSKAIISQAKAIFQACHAPDAQEMERELDLLVWEAFGLGVEEVGR